MCKCWSYTCDYAQITIIQDFWFKADIHKTNESLFEKKMFNDNKRRKELYKYLIKIKSKSISEDLI